MAITLKLYEDARQLVVSFDDQTVKTLLEKIPAIDRLQADPFTNGQALTAALGGDEMLKRLAEDADNLILQVFWDDGRGICLVNVTKNHLCFE